VALKYLLDTSVYCQPIKPQPLAPVIQRWEAAGDATLAISVLCQAEVLYGIALKDSSRLRKAYQAVLAQRLPVLPVDETVGQGYAEMRAVLEKSGRRIPDIDLLIASTARSHGLILATLNVRHFAAIPHLTMEDWSLPKESC